MKHWAFDLQGAHLPVGMSQILYSPWLMRKSDRQSSSPEQLPHSPVLMLQTEPAGSVLQS